MIAKRLGAIIKKEKKKYGTIHFTFCSDQYLHKLNLNYLKHDTLTDIITFQYPGKELNGDIFISIPRVKANAKNYQESFRKELNRVMLHGILHLCGYKDKTSNQKKLMRKKEDLYLRAFA